MRYYLCSYTYMFTHMHGQNPFTVVVVVLLQRRQTLFRVLNHHTQRAHSIIITHTRMAEYNNMHSTDTLTHGSRSVLLGYKYYYNSENTKAAVALATKKVTLKNGRFVVITGNDTKSRMIHVRARRTRRVH